VVVNLLCCAVNWLEGRRPGSRESSTYPLCHGGKPWRRFLHSDAPSLDAPGRRFCSRGGCFRSRNAASAGWMEGLLLDDWWF